MPFDYLQNVATEEEVARWRALFARAPEETLSDIRKQVADAMTRFEHLEKQARACRADAKGRLASWIGDLTRMSEALPEPTSVFRSSPDAHAIEEIRRMILRLEGSCRALHAVHPSFAQLAQDASVCRTDRQEAAFRLACAKQAVQGREEIYGELCILSDAFDAAHARWLTFSKEFTAWQSSWFDFCRARLPRFLQDLSCAADLSHACASCDASAVRRLCGELRFAAEKI